MKSWPPTFRIIGVTHCQDDGEFEGHALEIEWRGYRFEIGITRRERQL